MMAACTAVKHPFIDPETRLAPNVEVPYHALLATLFQAGLIFAAATLTPALLGPEPGDFEAVTIATAFVAGNFHARWQIDVDGDTGHSRPWQKDPSAARSAGRPFQLTTIQSPRQRGNPRNPRVLHLTAEEPNDPTSGHHP